MSIKFIYIFVPLLPVQLAEIQRLVLESYSLKEQLYGLEEELTQVSSSAEEEVWDQLVQKAERVKVSRVLGLLSILLSLSWYMFIHLSLHLSREV